MSKARTDGLTNGHFCDIIISTDYCIPLTLFLNADSIIKNEFLNLGIIWDSVVHRGTNSRKEEDIHGV